ncbi:MAG: hypothetical protein J6M60_01570 [Clostridia bacterium]|nr:hypothetical protein [Clostridia bacterium]
MITANEARAISERRNKEIVEQQIAEIERLIQLATEAGEFFTVFSGNIREETKKVLVDNGYNVYDDDVIEWEFIGEEQEEKKEETENVTDYQQEAEEYGCNPNLDIDEDYSEENTDSEVITETIFEDSEEEKEEVEEVSDEAASVEDATNEE